MTGREATLSGTFLGFSPEKAKGNLLLSRNPHAMRNCEASAKSRIVTCVLVYNNSNQLTNLSGSNYYNIYDISLDISDQFYIR